MGAQKNSSFFFVRGYDHGHDRQGKSALCREPREVTIIYQFVVINRGGVNVFLLFGAQTPTKKFAHWVDLLGNSYLKIVFQNYQAWTTSLLPFNIYSIKATFQNLKIQVNNLFLKRIFTIEDFSHSSLVQ